MSVWATIATYDDGTGNDVIDVARNAVNPGEVRVTLIDPVFDRAVERELQREDAIKLARALLEAAYP